jgi:acetyl esterase/lipase
MPAARCILLRPRWLVGGLVAGLAVALAAEAAEPRIERGLVVCRVAGQPIEADWVWPAVGTSRRRAVLFVHGGGWSAGSRRDYEPLALALAAQGYAGLLVDYRLAPAVRHPEAVQDLNCALRWLRRVAGERGVDPEQVAVIGGSAGAHLAGWVAHGRDDPTLDGPGEPRGQRARVTLAILHAGPHDLGVFDTLGPAQQGPVRALLGTVSPSPAQLAEASTVSRVSPGGPYTLILHGAQDPLVPPDQAKRLAAALARAGVPHRLVIIPGAGHADFGTDPAAVGRELLAALSR